LKGRARWLKSATVVKEKVVKDKEGRAEARAQAKAKAAAEKAVAQEAEEASKEKEEEMTAAVLQRKCNELVSSRGRKGTDIKAVLQKLERLAQLSVKFGPRVEIPMLMHVMTAQFDLVRTLDDYQDTPTWRACANYLERVASVLEDGDKHFKKYTLGTATFGADDLMVGNALSGKIKNKMMDAAKSGEIGARDAVAAVEALINPHTGESETEDERAERLRLEKEAQLTDEERSNIPVVGSLSLFITRLDEEYIKSLQRTSPHSAEYITRLRDEPQLVNLLRKVYNYYVRVDSKPEAAALAQLRLEHLYYCHDTILQKMNPEDSVNSAKLVQDLCTFIYQHGTDRSKTRAMLCHIYHHSLHDRFLEARDLLLMSHLQENISTVGDVSTMILFNRMMVNLGLCAFRQGRTWDAHQCLTEICSGRVRELLAQGVSTGRFAGDKSAEEEKAEKRRQIPYHQHINLELIEACHLISAMLLEVPNMAAAGDEAGRKTKIISRVFRKHNDIYDRQVFTGPPEQIRDFIMLASKSLMKGDWKKCATLLSDLDVWHLIPGENVVEQIKSMLAEKIKLEGLRTYLYAFSNQYESLSLAQLCEMFEMSKNEVHSIISKMMINREIHASWDQLTETIVLHKVEASSLQLLALQFAEKAANLVEANERLLDSKTGNFQFRDGEGHWKHGDQRGHAHKRGTPSGRMGRGKGGPKVAGRGGQRRSGAGPRR